MTAAAGKIEAADFAIVRAAARDGEMDRYLAALLSPREVRGDLIALAAFAAEVNRVPRLVREPHLAEIRLQWWRDALLAEPYAKTGNPVADAFANVLRRHRLSRTALEAWLEALAATCYPAELGTEAQLDGDLDRLEGTPFSFALAILNPDNPLQGQLNQNCARAYGIARLAADLPYALAQGRHPLPLAIEEARAFVTAKLRRHLVAIESGFPSLSRAQKCALLPVALVEPYLQALERPGHDLAHDIAEISPLARIWRIGMAHLRGAI